jgi:hypothetical protein
MDDKTKEFWNKYEERHGKVDTEVYDVSNFVYNGYEIKSQFVYKPFGTTHEMRPGGILGRGLSAVPQNSVDPTLFFWKQYEENYGPVDTELYDVSGFVYGSAKEKLQFIYKPYGTTHEIRPNRVLTRGLSAVPQNSVDPTLFFWKQYEEKHGPVEHEIYDVSGFVYKTAKEKLQFIYKPYGTVHEMEPSNIFSRGFGVYIKNAVDKTKFFLKEIEEKHGPIDYKVYDMSDYVYKGNEIKSQFVYKPYGTVHEMNGSDMLANGLSAVPQNSVDPTLFFWKKYEEIHGLVDTQLFDVSGFVYKGNKVKSKFIYKPYGTFHEVTPVGVLSNGLIAIQKNSIDPTEFFWKQYEEKHGLVDTGLYDISGFVYEANHNGLQFIYKPLGTTHEMSLGHVKLRGLNDTFGNSVDPKDYLTKRWASKSELVTYVQKAFEYIQKNSKDSLASATESDDLYREYYKQNKVYKIPHSLYTLESVYGVGGMMDQYGLKENVIEL